MFSGYGVTVATIIMTTIMETKMWVDPNDNETVWGGRKIITVITNKCYLLGLQNWMNRTRKIQWNGTIAMKASKIEWTCSKLINNYISVISTLCEKAQRGNRKFSPPFQYFNFIGKHIITTVCTVSIHWYSILAPQSFPLITSMDLK